MNRISPLELRRLLLGDGELALIDVRGQGAFSTSHLLHAACIPLSHLELVMGDLVPGRNTPVVVVDEPDQEPLSDRACRRLAELGYTEVAALDGGVSAWRDAGFEVFSGVNVPSKAFGEFVEHAWETPRLTAREAKAMLDSGREVVIVDARPFQEYHRMNIPSAINVPGAELVLRIHDLAPDPDTFVLVNCAGRTRSIIGAQSLINAGIANPVAALKDGTMGWHLAGFELEKGARREAGPPSAAGLEWARRASARVAERFSVPAVAPEVVARWLEDPRRTTYLLDVRSPGEYVQGHLPGYRNAPGGQLVQATDEYVAVRNARLVLADDEGVRAAMTASWLMQMGWRDVHVLEGGLATGPRATGEWAPTVLGEVADATVTGDALARMLADTAEAVRVIDLGSSTDYERQHVPGALWCARARLGEAMATLPDAVRVVLTSRDGLLARLALGEARARGGRDVQALRGGTREWIARGHATESGLSRVFGDTDDVWYKPYEHRGAQEKFMRDYLTWEVALVEQIRRDGTTRFRAD